MHSSQYCVATPDWTAAIISADGAAAKPADIGLVVRSPPAVNVWPPLPARPDGTTAGARAPIAARTFGRLPILCEAGRPGASVCGEPVARRIEIAAAGGSRTQPPAARVPWMH